MANDCGIPCNSISVRNPQANAIVERVHQTIDNIICAFKIHQIDLDDENPWEGILSSTMVAIRSTVHTTTQNTPLQYLVGTQSSISTKKPTGNELYNIDRR